MRSRPFGEWVLIYFDKSKITEIKLLDLCKKKGCKRAAVIAGKTAKSGNTSAKVVNPYICAGDTLVLEIESDGKDKLSVDLPDGWKADISTKIAGKKTVFVQTSAKTAQGAKVLKLKVGEATVELKCDVVRKIR